MAPAGSPPTRCSRGSCSARGPPPPCGRPSSCGRRTWCPGPRATRPTPTTRSWSPSTGTRCAASCGPTSGSSGPTSASSGPGIGSCSCARRSTSTTGTSGSTPTSWSSATWPWSRTSSSRARAGARSRAVCTTRSTTPRRTRAGSETPSSIRPTGRRRDLRRPAVTPRSVNAGSQGQASVRARPRKGTLPALALLSLRPRERAPRGTDNDGRPRFAEDRRVMVTRRFRFFGPRPAERERADFSAASAAVGGALPNNVLALPCLDTVGLGGMRRLAAFGLAGWAAWPGNHAWAGCPRRAAPAREAGKPGVVGLPDALRSDDAHRAYSLLTENVRKEITYDAFAAQWKEQKAERQQQARTLAEDLRGGADLGERARVAFPDGKALSLHRQSGNWRLEAPLLARIHAATPHIAVELFAEAAAA